MTDVGALDISLFSYSSYACRSCRSLLFVVSNNLYILAYARWANIEKRSQRW